jgi:dipeptidyl aminopeptidase/acylaminoacyl peptidase
LKRLLLVTLVAVLTVSAYAEKLQLSDRFRLVGVSDPQFSPDGRTIVCVVSWPDTKDNRHDSELVAFDVTTGAQRPLTFERRGLASPRLSPDGAQIAFLANASAEKDAKRQLWILSLQGGDAKRMTDAAKGVQQFVWSPDGKSLAFVTADEPEKKSDADRHNMSFEVGDDDFLVTAAPTPSHVWIVPAAGGAARRLTKGAWSLPVAHPPGPAPSPLSWSADGKFLAISRLETPHSGNGDTSRVELVDVSSGAERRLTTNDIAESQPVFSPDGKHIAFWHPLGGERLAENHIWVTAPDGGMRRDATASIDRNVFRAIWFPDSRSFLTGGHDGTSTAFWIVPLEGEPKKLDLGDIEPSWLFWIDAAVSRSGAIAFTGTTASRGRELYVMETPEAKPRRLTNLNAEVASRQLGRSERIAWKNEGFEEDGVLIYPPDFDPAAKYPLVLYIHGGPRAASTTGFSFLPQLFAAQGWVVFQPNYRGSDNLGNKYERAIVGDAGAGPGRDVMAGIEAVKKRGFVDANRIVVGGWSYGGYMTSWMIGHYPIFKAAVSGAAVNNLLDQYTLGDMNAARRFAMGGSPYVGDNMKKYIDQSPITYAANIKAPTLIMSDTGDYRVPITQSFQMYHALKDNGVETKFIAFPVGGHSPDDPIHQSEIDRRYVEWFSRFIGTSADKK